MALTPYCKSEKTARKLLADTGLSIFMWDSEWDEFAAFAPTGSSVTPQNIRGALKRTLRVKGYVVDILEDELSLPADPKPTGATFRFRKMRPEERPKTKPPAPPAQRIAPSFEPEDRTTQLQLEMW